jgi:hypothetical protein
LFQKKGQLGHPDEINAKEISLGRQMNTDQHGLKIKFVSHTARYLQAEGLSIQMIL